MAVFKYRSGRVDITPTNSPDFIKLPKAPRLHYDNTTKHYYLTLNNTTKEWFIKHMAFWQSIETSGLSEVIKGLKDLKYPTLRVGDIEMDNLKGVTLYDHQVEAVRYMLNYKRFCLYFGTGTGKTFMMLTYLKSMAALGKRRISVIVTKKAIANQIVIEANKKLDYYPDIFNVGTINSKKYLVKEGLHSGSNNLLLVINYESINKLLDILQELNNEVIIDDLIFDESHTLKNRTSKAYTRAKLLAKMSSNVYMFSGTPKDSIEYEKVVQYSILHPILMHTKTHFIQRHYEVDKYYKPIKSSLRYADEIEEMNRSLSYGGQTEELLDLPDQQVHIVNAKMPAELRMIYNEMTKEGIVELDDGYIRAKGAGGKKIKQRQIARGFCSGELEDDEGRITPTVFDFDSSHTLDAMHSVIKEVGKRGEQVIIFAQFTREIEHIMEYLAKTPIGTFVTGPVDGSTPGKKVNEYIDEFKSGKKKIIVMQVKSGSTGLDLKCANNIIFYSLPDGDMVTYTQAKYRIRRIGQEKVCNYYHIRVPGSRDAGMLRKLDIKESEHLDQFSIYGGKHEK